MQVGVCHSLGVDDIEMLQAATNVLSDNSRATILGLGESLGLYAGGWTPEQGTATFPCAPHLPFPHPPPISHNLLQRTGTRA